MPNEKKPSGAPTASEAPASKPSARPVLDTPFVVKLHASSDAPGEKATPAPDSLGAAVEMFADSVARSTGSSPPTPPSAPPISSRTGLELKGLLTAMEAALRDGDHERAIRAADLALRKKPGLVVAVMCKKESERVLEADYLKRIGPLSHVSRVRADDAERRRARCTVEIRALARRWLRDDRVRHDGELYGSTRGLARARRVDRARHDRSRGRSTILSR